VLEPADLSRIERRANPAGGGGNPGFLSELGKSFLLRPKVKNISNISGSQTFALCLRAFVVNYSENSGKKI
jgi:hypothetical protein